MANEAKDSYVSVTPGLDVGKFGTNGAEEAKRYGAMYQHDLTPEMRAHFEAQLGSSDLASFQDMRREKIADVKAEQPLAQRRHYYDKYNKSEGVGNLINGEKEQKE